MTIPDRRFRPQLHVLVCTNERSPDSALPCCAAAQGERVAEALRQGIARSPLRGQVWVTRSGCLTFCNQVGATVVVYPAAQWFTEVVVEDVPRIVQELLRLAAPQSFSA